MQQEFGGLDDLVKERDNKLQELAEVGEAIKVLDAKMDAYTVTLEIPVSGTDFAFLKQVWYGVKWEAAQDGLDFVTPFEEWVAGFLAAREHGAVHSMYEMLIEKGFEG